MRFLIVAAGLTAAIAGPVSAQAQTTAVEGRVDRLEREMRAVQRKVFPGGAGHTIEPQIVPDAATTEMPGVPSGSPVADLTQRVAALENQVQSLTGQVEQDGYRLRQIEDGFGAYKRATDARLKALEDGGAQIGASGAPVIAPVDLGETSTRPTRPATRPPAEETPAAKPTGTRAQQVAAIQKPNSGDPAEDGYTYGYRLWQAKLYPEARRELEAVATKYPEHRRASFSQNLLGRAYLDAGAPSLAAVAFYENYKKNPNGERAPDSLYYLAQALTKLKKPASEVCKVYTELDQLYGARLSAEMKNGIAEGRVAQKCK
jgi:TolA-binding protein